MKFRSSDINKEIYENSEFILRKILIKSDKEIILEILKARKAK